MSRYVYLGDALTDAMLVNRACDPVRRPDGKCIVSQQRPHPREVFNGGLLRMDGITMQFRRQGAADG